MTKKLMVAAMLVAASMAHAQTSPAKKELIAKVLQLQQPNIEAVARQLAERPAAVLMQQAASALQFRIAPEKRDALAKDIQADLKKYVDESVPVIRDRAVKLGPSTIGTVLEERFTEDELRQLVALLESPIQKKFSQMSPEIQKSLAEKLVAETRGVIEPKVKVLEQSITKRLNDAGGQDGTGGKPPAK